MLFKLIKQSCKQVIRVKHHHSILSHKPNHEVIYVMTATNKRLLISERRGDSNQCTPCRGKPDQHTTRFPCSVHVWSKTIHISRGPHIATFCETPTDLDGSRHSREKGLPTQSTACRLSDPWVRTQFLSRANQWSSGCKPGSCLWPTTRLTGPINTSMRSVRSILACGGQPIGP
jgi:hypothetical protein